MKRILAIMAAMGLLLLTGCGQTPAGEPAAAGTATLAVSIGEEPLTLDPGCYTTTEEATVISHLFEGLTRENADGTLSGGVAESWSMEMVGDQVKRPVYTFHLREDACWSDGQPVKATDFIYAWTRIISGEAQSPYAYLFDVIYNALDYAAGKEVTLGLDAKDDHTLAVTLEGDCSYFPLLTSLPVFAPVRQDVTSANSENWYSQPETCISNGAYCLAEWVHDDYATLAPSAHYRDTASTNGMNLKFRFLDEKTRAKEFSTGELGAALCAGNAENTVACPTGLSYYYAVNTDTVTDAKVRLALSMALDRAALIQELGLSGRVAACGLTGGETAVTEDVTGAKDLLKESESLPKKLTLLTNTTTGGEDDLNTRLANAAAKCWRNTLGITVEVKALPYDEFIEARDAGEYDLVRCGTALDFDDPAAILALFANGASSNTAMYASTKYNTLLSDSDGEEDTAARAAQLKEAEQLIVEGDAAVIPLMRGQQMLQCQKGLTGITVNGMGILDFSRAEMVKG